MIEIIIRINSMLRKLLLTAAFVSSAGYGADTLTPGVLNSATNHSRLESTLASGYTSESVAATLDRIQTTFIDSAVSSVVLQKTILELSTFVQFKRFKCANISECSIHTNFKPAAILDLEFPEIEGVVNAQATLLLPFLIKMLSDPEYSESKELFGLFLLAVFYADLTPYRLEILMSDTSLLLKDKWLASTPKMKSYITLFLVCKLIDAVTDPVHIKKLQELILRHRDVFLKEDAPLILPGYLSYPLE
jgi:hypothetical protein